MATAIKNTQIESAKPFDRNDTGESERGAVGTIELQTDRPLIRIREKIAKSKHPQFRSATFYVRKKTYADCDYQLKNDDDPRDMSELIEDLMRQWLAARSSRH